MIANVQEKLQLRQQANLWRQHEICPKNALCFRSNDYLGLANHPCLVQTFKSALDEYGVGSQGAALLGGYSEAHRLLEKALAQFTGFQRALLFSTGYMANFAVIMTLAKQLSIAEIYSDRLNHASIIDGMQLSKTKFYRFPHRDYAYLKQLLLKTNLTKKKLIITEGVFGMEGDIADLPALLQLSKNHNSVLMIDDAHGFGVLGAHGRGTLEHYQLSPNSNVLLVGTFGKALGTFGAFVAASNEWIELLIQYARPYLFTTATLPALAASTLTSLKLIQTESWRRDQLKKLIKQFQAGAQSLNLPLLPSETPIQPILTRDPALTLQCYETLKQQQIWVGAVRPPTVPENHCRLRINLSAAHTSSNIERLLEVLQGLKGEGLNLMKTKKKSAGNYKETLNENYNEISKLQRNTE